MSPTDGHASLAEHPPPPEAQTPQLRNPSSSSIEQEDLLPGHRFLFPQTQRLPHDSPSSETTSKELRRTEDETLGLSLAAIFPELGYVPSTLPMQQSYDTMN